MAMLIANLPGHKVLFIGGSAHEWTVPSLFDQYATSARHWFVEAFERGGGNPRAVVTSGCAIYGRIERKPNDNFHFAADTTNFNLELMAEFAA
eukprot:12233148-Prorocentrum_lima.AAC.1